MIAALCGGSLWVDGRRAAAIAYPNEENRIGQKEADWIGLSSDSSDGTRVIHVTLSGGAFTL